MAISTPVRIRKVPQPKVRIRVLPKIIPADGEAATIEIGTVTTLAAGSDATVVNSGTENAAVLDFGLPRGAPGVVESIIAGTNVSVDATDPANPIVSASGDVASVNGQTGIVVLDADDIDDTSTTNKFATAAELSKLAGIEANADVTDASNVAAAGAVMESDTSTASMSFVIDEDDMASDSATKVPTQQSVKAYVDAHGGLPSNYVLAESYGAVGDGVTDDGPAINAALADVGVGGVVLFGNKVYATEETISVHQDGQKLIGVMGGATFSVSPTTTEGTVLKWTGASGGTLCYFGCEPGGSADMSGGGIEGIQFDGNLLADKVLHIRSCSFSVFKHVKALNARNNASAWCMYLDSDVQARAGVNCIFRCNFYNTAIATGGAAAGGLLITGAPDESAARHPAFTSFHGLHVTHDDGDAIKLTSADDLLFADVGVSKAAGGTGISVHCVPNAGRAVVGLTFVQVHLGSNDTPEFRADASAASSNCHGIAIYGLQGVDEAPTVTETGGATIEIVDYLGEVYDADAATRGAYRKTPPLKIGNFASADDATLDYYKEKLGNVSLTFGGGAVGLTASATFYRSTRIGNVVNFKVQVTLTNKGSSTGSAVISGLPYSTVDGFALAIDVNNMTSGVGDTHLSATTSTTAIALWKVAAGVRTALTNADFTNTSSLVISGVYITTDAAA